MLPDSFHRTKLVKNAKIQMRYFEEFSNNVQNYIDVDYCSRKEMRLLKDEIPDWRYERRDNNYFS